ncbi:MAG TPA: carotenoid oxygenase family protein [Terriglobales bacterium]
MSTQTNSAPAANRFLQGPFAPVTEEIATFDLPVTGHLPPELNGRYLRNGPNPMRMDDPNYHWFVGSGMIHGVRLRGGRAEWYRNRWVRSKVVAEALRERWPGGPVHGKDAAPNTHIILHSGRILATIESGPLPYELSDELSTLHSWDFAGTLPAGFAAHTKPDFRTGELHAVAYSPWSDNVQHVVVDRNGRVVRITDIAVTDKPMMHDFALTDRYVVLYDLPVTLSVDAAKAGSELPYTWNPKHEARVGLLRRDGSSTEVRWFGIDPCFVFHTLNGYDDGDRVVVDLCRYEDFDVSLLAGSGRAMLDRWTIDPSVGKVASEHLSDHFQEFPRVDPRVLGRQHRYGYTTVIAELEQDVLTARGSGCNLVGHPFGVCNVLLKHDLKSGTVEKRDFGRSAAAGEAVFVPTSPNAKEDDGYLMAFVHDLKGGATDLIIFASQDFAGEPVARVHLPARVPLGFHGNWIADP